VGRKLIAIITGVLYACLLHAQQLEDTISNNPLSTKIGDTTIAQPSFQKPKPFAFIKNVPKDVWGISKSPFEKNGWKGFAVIAASSALLIHFDQPLLHGAQQLGSQWHLHPETDYKTLITIKNGSSDIKIFKVPQNLNSAFYTLGEGWIGVALGAGFWVQGKIAHNNRSLQTASDLMEGFVSAAVITQLVKRTSGRQSPFARTADGGIWTLFPSFQSYQKNTSNYDAFPSGHLTTMMTTVTILAENYPEYKWIKPLGYFLMGCTSFAMMNTEVHWIGDYPLALAFGYLNGRLITKRHQRTKKLKAIW
jgi:membrane-associated phospholipid phosphatase